MCPDMHNVHLLLTDGPMGKCVHACVCVHARMWAEDGKSTGTNSEKSGRRNLEAESTRSRAGSM